MSDAHLEFQIHVNLSEAGLIFRCSNMLSFQIYAKYFRYMSRISDDLPIFHSELVNITHDNNPIFWQTQ